MRFRLLVGTVCVAALVVPCTASAFSNPTAAARAHQHYSVRWDFFLNAMQAASKYGPNDPPPGSDLPCHPSAVHPRPVVLVHGLGADQSDNWEALSPFLANHGYCVFSLTYGNNPTAPGFFNRIGGLADMTQSAHVLARFVRHVVRVTGAKQVDLLGHSEGGTMPDWYLKYDGGTKYVDHFVDLSGVLHGTTFWGVSSLYAAAQQLGYTGKPSFSYQSWCFSCLADFLPSSAWIKTLDTPHPHASRHEAGTCAVDGAAVNGINYTSIATRYDELVRPPTSDFIDPECANPETRIGVHNILIQQQCPQDLSDHLSIAADPNVAQDILNALDPAHRHPVHCQLVLPSVG